jgi:hypothetical protein
MSNEDVIINDYSDGSFMVPVPIPNLNKKAGRPKGSSPSKKLSAEMILKAKNMYIAGKSMVEIGKELNLTSLNTLYRYMDKENWELEREKYFQQNSEMYLSTLLSASLAETQEMLMDLKAIRDTSIEAIDTKVVVPKRFSEASKSYTDAVDASMKIRAEALQLSFVIEIGKILKEKIKDPKLLMEISTALRDLFKNKRMETLKSGK